MFTSLGIFNKEYTSFFEQKKLCIVISWMCSPKRWHPAKLEEFVNYTTCVKGRWHSGILSQGDSIEETKEPRPNKETADQQPP